MLQRRTALLAALLLAMVAAADARIPRNEAERLKDEERLRRQQESGIHTYYVLVKPPQGGSNDRARAESLAADFHKRLGGDKHISIAAASKVCPPAPARPRTAPRASHGSLLPPGGARAGLWPLLPAPAPEPQQTYVCVRARTSW